MKQADLGLNLTTQRTRKREVLAGMERVVRLPLKTGVPPCQYDRIQQRVVGNDYMRSVQTLLELAGYRLVAVAALPPSDALLRLVLLADSLLARLIKAKEFRHLNPEMFGLYIGTAIVAARTCALALVTAPAHTGLRTTVRWRPAPAVARGLSSRP